MTQLSRRPPRWVYAPRQRWDLIGPLAAEEVRARLAASPRFAGSVEEGGRVGLVWRGGLLPVGPEVRGDVAGRTGGSVLTLEGRLATPVAVATTLWVAVLFAAAVATAGVLAFGAVLLVLAGLLGVLVVGTAFQLAARRCLRELRRLSESVPVVRPDPVRGR